MKAKTGPDRDDEHEIVYFRRHVSNDPGRSVPGREFLDRCPVKVRATMRAVLVAVAQAPPHMFAGGGYWEAIVDFSREAGAVTRVGLDFVPLSARKQPTK